MPDECSGTVWAEEGKRKAGRPVVVQDEAIFRAVYNVLSQQGPGRVTLAAVANELGISSPALIKRFRSRRGLMLASTHWAVDSTRIKFRDSPRDFDSPLEALRNGHLMPMGEVSHDVVIIREYSNVVQLYFGEAQDPEIRDLWGQWTEAYEQETIRYLREAIAAGELRRECDPERLGHALHSAITGMVILWFGHPERASQERLREVFDTIIDPHLRS